MSQSENKLSSKQRAGIAALLDGLSISGAAARVGVHRRTMARWLQNETFCEELRQESQGALMASRARFALLFDQSLAILSDALQGGRVSGCERWAVSLVLRHAAALSAHFDLTARVERLEALP